MRLLLPRNLRVLRHWASLGLVSLCCCSPSAPPRPPTPPLADPIVRAPDVDPEPTPKPRPAFPDSPPAPCIDRPSVTGGKPAMFLHCLPGGWQALTISPGHDLAADLAVLREVPPPREVKVYSLSSTDAAAYLDAIPPDVVTQIRFENGDGRALQTMTRFEYLDTLEFVRSRFADLTWLVDVPGLRTLSFQLCDLQGATLPPLPKLETLGLGQVQGISKISLDGFDALVGLDLGWIDPLPHRLILPHKGLETLGLSHTKVENLGWLEALPKLSSLDLSSTLVSDLGPLEKLNELREVRVRATNVGSLAPLKQHKQLEVVDVSQTKVRDLSPLLGGTSLREVHLDETPVADLSPLAPHRDLEVLTAFDTQVADISALQGATDLRWVDLRYTQVTDAAPLAESVGMTKLELRGTRVRDAGPLAGLVELEMLSLAESNVSDITPLSGLSKITLLDLVNTKVTDIESLRTMTALENVWLQGTLVRDIQALALLPRLVGVNLCGAPVRSLVPLYDISTLEWVELSANYPRAQLRRDEAAMPDVTLERCRRSSPKPRAPA